MEIALRCLGPDATFATSSFVARIHPSESCGANGLPLTPNSIAIMGLAQRLKAVSAGHPNLCCFLECFRGKHERVVVIQEHLKDSLHCKLAEGDAALHKDDFILHMAQDILDALVYLHRLGMPCATLDPSKVMFTSSASVKLSHFGLGFMTSYGSYVSFPIFNPRFVAPEVIASGYPEPPNSSVNRRDDDQEAFECLTQIPEPLVCPYDARCDIWSLGMILLCCSLRVPTVWPNLKIPQVLRTVLSFRDYQGNIIDRIVRETHPPGVDDGHRMSECLRHVIDACLQPDVTKRPSAEDLLLQFFGKPAAECDARINRIMHFPTAKLRSINLTWPAQDRSKSSETQTSENDESNPVHSALSVQEVFYLWNLAGGDVFGDLRKHGLMVTRPSILSLPKVVLGEGHNEGQAKERCSLYDPINIKLSLAQLKACLQDVSIDDSYPLLVARRKSNAATRDEMSNLPLVIKERDVRYQFKRVIRFRRLLQSYPYLKDVLIQESRLDTTPMYRAQIWAALLGIEHDTVERYNEIDKETWTPTDRQIEVDIPRCHQYNSLLSSPEGHRKFKRVLKAWVASNPQYVYWQGLDSLCAPFLYLNFNDEPLAYACLSAFIPKYLHGMFRRDNAEVIQEYLAKFSHMQAFHDPELFNHLNEISFIPDLYAIPWILTMFAHVFPLHNIFHLWDQLLLGDSSFPLSIGLAVLYQLRERLMQAEFNDCILLFSDLPAIDIEKCVQDSVRIFHTTPKSLTWRKFGSGSQDTANKSGLQIDSITLQQQKLEKVPRIGGDDLLQLLGLSQHDLSNRKEEMNGSEAGALVLDIRSPQEHQRGTLPGTITLPKSAKAPLEETISSDLIEELSKSAGKTICIAGTREQESETTEFANSLLRQNIPRICTLHNGMDIFRFTPGVLVVPNT